LLLKKLEDDFWEVMVKPGNKLKPGTRVVFGNGILKAEILDKGLLIALSSPYDATLNRTHIICQDFATRPQFLVDAFVNYDCDESGIFRNIFENTISLIAKQCQKLKK